MIFRIFADFNRRTTDEHGDRIFIGQAGSWQIDAYPLKNYLQPGSTIKLFDGELQVEAILEFDKQNGSWYGRPNWSTRRDLKSSTDGLEDYANADSDHKLAILRYELGIRIAVIKGYADLLKQLLPTPAPSVPRNIDSGKLVGDLAITADDLERILQVLAGP